MTNSCWRDGALLRFVELIELAQTETGGRIRDRVTVSARPKWMSRGWVLEALSCLASTRA